MIHLKQAVVVEGKYDKIKLSSVLDALIITTDGFSIFKDKEKTALIRKLAEKDGIIILTDSDSAGFKIRNYIRGCTEKGNVINIYIPEIMGKEKRKNEPSKEGKLGVEGMTTKILIEAFEKAGIAASENNVSPENKPFSKITLYEDGLVGKKDSEKKRKALLKELGLPSMLSANALTETLNGMFSAEEYRRALNKINDRKESL